MRDPDSSGADVKLPTEFTGMTLTHSPFLGARNFIFPYPREIKVDFVVLLNRGERNKAGISPQKKSEIKCPQHHRTEQVLVMKLIYEGL